MYVAHRRRVCTWPPAYRRRPAELPAGDLQTDGTARLPIPLPDMCKILDNVCNPLFNQSNVYKLLRQTQKLACDLIYDTASSLLTINHGQDIDWSYLYHYLCIKESFTAQMDVAFRRAAAGESACQPDGNDLRNVVKTRAPAIAGQKM